jgi:hypothetical protein
MEYLVFFRELFVKNYGVSIKSIEINFRIKLKNSIFFYLLRLIPFSILKFIFDYFNNNKIINIHYIYYMDNLYFSNHLKSSMIYPLIFNIDMYNNESYISIKDSLKKYNMSIPIWFFLYNEKLDNYTNYKIKYMVKGKIIEKEDVLDNVENKLLKDFYGEI